MDAGMMVLEGIVVFIVVGGFLVSIAPAIILDIIWIIRVKLGKSPKFGPLGIISITVSALTLMGLPYEFVLLIELVNFVR